jgi:nitrogen fixation protein NifU and related proteins
MSTNATGANATGANVSPDAQLSALYQEIILDHYRRPRNKGTLEAPDEQVQIRNPLCGDEVELAVKFDGDTVAEVRFTGKGCSISQASASMMTQAVKGKSREEAAALFQQFHKLVHGESAEKSLGELRAMAGVSRFPARMRCALLAWGALHEVLGRRK